MNHEKKYSGTTDPEVREYEVRHRAVARKAAAAGIVLLKNEGQILPLLKGTKVALYGSGAVYTVKGGTGSGDVNVRDVVSIYQGMEQAGFEVTNKSWLEGAKKSYEETRINWRDEIWKKADSLGIAPGAGLFYAYTQIPFRFPVGGKPEKTEADTAFYVLSRTAGENADRTASRGDYYLTEEEEKMIHELCKLYENVILVLNAGGVVDLSILDKEPVKAVVYLQQPGMEGGNAFADVISGKVSPSGKLTDTWAYHYEDYPNSEWFSHNNGNVEKEFYHEDIYVGYRYFDTYQIPVRYGFGFGLSYAEFDLEFLGTEVPVLTSIDNKIQVKVKVTNTSDSYSGQEVVQVYIACPEGKMQKERRRLTGFAKTPVLAPKESTEVTVSFPLRSLESFDEKASANVIEPGTYGIYAGNSLENSVLCADLKLTGKEVQESVEHVCVSEDQKLLENKLPERQSCQGMESGKQIYYADLSGVETEYHDYTENYEIPEAVLGKLEVLSTEQLILLTTGDLSADQAGSSVPEESEKEGGSEIGAAGTKVPGSAAETSSCAREQGIEPVVLADGPAGLRLIKVYYTDGDQPTAVPFDQAIEEGFLCRNTVEPTGTKHYQYCTAFPVGTMLAQTWDQKMIEAVGDAVAEEMELFGVKFWLAPGMNIHRNPLCGRNFEYFSEDPVVAGLMAAAMTSGVQKHQGRGVTIKHFACNNQEDNRTNSDSIVSERALREIYLKGFEIAVREVQPMALMTSYNLVNGVHAANNYDLCTKVLRKEWGFKGVVMTDWGTTDGADCNAAGCMRAGNDLVMPGSPMDHENLREELKNGTLKPEELKRSVARVINAVGSC